MSFMCSGQTGNRQGEKGAGHVAKVKEWGLEPRPARSRTTSLCYEVAVLPIAPLTTPHIKRKMYLVIVLLV